MSCHRRGPCGLEFLVLAARVHHRRVCYTPSRGRPRVTDLSTYWKDYDPETGVGDPSTPLAAQTLNEWGADVEQIRADAENFRNQAQEFAEQAEAPTDAMVASVVANPSSDAHAAVAGVIDAKSPTVSVVTFGAVGDGVADDT